MVENGLVVPGDIVIGGDSHTCTYGALGSFSTGMGSTDIGVAFAIGKIWFKIPETINIEIRGQFRDGVYAKDIILKIISELGVDYSNYKVLEFSGETVQAMEIHERLTLSNMAIEAGAKAGLIEGDQKTIDYLQKITKPSSFDIPRAVNPVYTKKIVFDVSNLSPQVACPHDLDNVKPVSEVEGTKIDEVFIGTCTNGRYEDLEIAANILNGKHVSPFTRTIIIPASRKIYQKAIQNGLMDIFCNSGCIICNPGCGPCLGRHQGVLAPGERALTTMNRNFKGRMGSPDSFIYLASPATCAISAINGVISNPAKE